MKYELLIMVRVITEASTPREAEKDVERRVLTMFDRAALPVHDINVEVEHEQKEEEDAHAK